MADDVQQVELEILDTKAGQVLADFKRKLEETGNVKLGSGFSSEIKSSLDQAERKALSLQGSLKSLAAVSPSGKGLDWISKQSIASQKEIAGVNAKLQSIQKLASQTSSKSLLKIYEDDAKTLAIQLDAAEKKMLRLSQARFNKAAPSSSSGNSSGFGQGALDATGLPLSSAAIGGAAVVGAIKIGSDLVKSAKDQEGSLNQLAAAAKQAGVGFDVVNSKEVEFARVTGQSEAAARGSFASIIEFSKQAGRLDQVDKLSTGLANLFAAKNIPQDKMNDLLSQLKTGQDEVFDRLAGANPSKFYNEYAASIGTTADKLTDAQKAQVRFDTVVKLSTIFDGSAEKRLKSMSGQLDSVSAGFENLYNRAGKGAAPFFKQQLENLTNLFDFSQGKGLFASPEEKAKLKEQIQKDAEERAKLIVDGFRSQESKIADAQKNPFGSLDNLALSKVDQGKFKLASIAQEIEEVRADGSKLTRFENQGEVNARLAEIIDNAKKEAEAELKARKEAFESVLSDKNSSVSLLQLAQKEFLQTQNIFPPEAREKLRRDFAEAISSGIAKGFEMSLQAVDLNAEKLVSGLRKLQAGVAGLLPETTAKLINDYEKALKSMSEKAIALRDTVKDALVAGVENNQLLKLMVDLDSATERAEKRFGLFGDAIVKKMADIDKSVIQSQINKLLFEGSKKALEFEQEARRLSELPDSQTNQFDRRLSLVGTTANFASQQADLSRKAQEAAFFARGYNPNDPKTFDQSRFGSDLGRVNPAVQDALGLVNTLKGLSDQGTGAAGKGLIAERIAAALPDREILLAELSKGGGRADAAKTLLEAAATAAEAQKTAAEAAFKDALAMDQIKQNAVRDAEEKLRNLDLNGKGLSDPQKIQEFLAITGELGDQNLNPTLKAARIQAFGVAATQTRQEAVKQAEQAKIVSDTMTEINKQLLSGGLKTKLSETPIVDIQIRDNTLSASQRSLGSRANSNDVKRLSQ